MQRVKGSKGQNVIEVHSRLGHLKNISHPSLFPEEGPSCVGCVLKIQKSGNYHRLLVNASIRKRVV